jgi:hypothetical protein
VVQDSGDTETSLEISGQAGRKRAPDVALHQRSKATAGNLGVMAENLTKPRGRKLWNKENMALLIHPMASV